MSIFDRVEGLWREYGEPKGEKFQDFVDNYMVMNFNAACSIEEYYIKGDKEEFVGNYYLSYKLDVENRNIELSMEGCWN